MKKILCVLLLLIATLSSQGCEYSGDAIIAEARTIGGYAVQANEVKFQKVDEDNEQYITRTYHSGITVQICRYPEAQSAQDAKNEVHNEMK